jgi:predicted Zn-dependent peptidase
MQLNYQHRQTSTLTESEQNIVTHTLPNGLRIIHKPTASNVAYCGFFINAGTRDERVDQFGMAHFTEHMLFKGTQKRKSFHIINRMENVGGELNAYTNKEETVIYAVFIEEHIERAIELLTDLTFHSVFPQKEINKEIDVVIDEINSYEDNPSELIYDEFENLVFAGHQLGHHILGESELLKTFNSEKVAEFVHEHYSPSQMVFFSMGKVQPKKLIRLVEKLTEDIVQRGYQNRRIAPQILEAEMLKVEKDTSQAHTIIGTYSYPIHDEKRRALSLLNNMLGGPGMNSRLNISLREKYGYVYSVESSLTNYSDTGLFAIYFGGDQRNQQKCVELVMKELDKFRTTKLSSTQLAAAKKQYIGQTGISHNMQENVALALGKSLFYFDKWFSESEIIQFIEKITAEKLLEVANELFEKDRLFCLQYN